MLTKTVPNAGGLKEVVANLQTTVYTYNDNGSVAQVEYDSGVKEKYTYNGGVASILSLNVYV